MTNLSPVPACLAKKALPRIRSLSIGSGYQAEKRVGDHSGGWSFDGATSGGTRSIGGFLSAERGSKEVATLVVRGIGRCWRPDFDGLLFRQDVEWVGVHG